MVAGRKQIETGLAGQGKVRQLLPPRRWKGDQPEPHAPTVSPVPRSRDGPMS